MKSKKNLGKYLGIIIQMVFGVSLGLCTALLLNDIPLVIFILILFASIRSEERRVGKEC